MTSASARFSVAMIVPDGVGIRNCLHGPLAPLLHRNGGCLAYLPPAGGGPADAANELSSFNVRRLVAYRETALSFSLRHSLAYAQMYWGDTRAMRRVRRRSVKGSWRTKAARLAARGVGRIFSFPAGIRLLDRAHCRVVAALTAVEHYRREFENSKPRVLFCSHQRPPIILPAVLAARELGIPTATFIFSWDNLTSKGRIAAPFDHFLVWSDLMKAELLRYYPDVRPDRVHVVGTPQFDPYADASLLWTREEFFARIGADPARPLLCYSGGDHGTCPEDPAHVRVLMELVRSGRIQRRPQVLVRPAPVDDGKRYAEVRNAFSELIFAQPAWIHPDKGDWSGVFPLRKDVQFLANLTHHTDVNVNLASTMTLDFAVHDKPVVNVAFDVADPPPLGEPLWDLYYQFEHYRPVVELGAARFARSPAELAEHINAYLAEPGLDREARRRLVELEVGVPVGQSSARIVEVLEAIAGRRRSDERNAG